MIIKTLKSLRRPSLLLNKLKVSLNSDSLCEPFFFLEKAEEQTTTQQEAPAKTQQASKEARKFLTPQLSADLSQFSGLSLRLEDDRKKALSNFPLRQGRPFVIGVRNLFSE